LPVHARYGLILQSSLDHAEDGKSWIRASSRSDHREALHRDLQPNPPQFEKGGHCKKTESRREAQNCPKITKDELRPFLTIFGTGMRAKYCRGLQWGSLTPIFFCLDSRFPIVNNIVIRTFRSISSILGKNEGLSQKLDDYPSNMRKLWN